MVKGGRLNRRYVGDLWVALITLKGPVTPCNFSEIHNPKFYHVKLKLGHPTRIGQVLLAREDQSPSVEKKPKPAKPAAT